MKIFIVLLAMAFLVSFGCKDQVPDVPMDAPIVHEPKQTDLPVVGEPDPDDATTDSEAVFTPSPSAAGQLIALAETQEEAEKIAELYGIELLSFSDGVAVFYTEEDLDGVIACGRENGWTELSKNNLHTFN